MTGQNPKWETSITSNPFDRVEHLIRFTFEQIARAVIERRDQILVQLHDLKLNYLNKEIARKKQLTDLENIMGQLNEAYISRNQNAHQQEDYTLHMREEMSKSKHPTPSPFPVFNTEGLQFLMQLLECFGSVQDRPGLYKDKIKAVKCFGKRGSKKGELYHPRGVALHEDSMIYVSDCGNCRIQVFSIDGKFISEFGKGHLKEPSSIVLYDRWIFVSDQALNAILKFEQPNYKLISSSVDGMLDFPLGLTADSNGRVLVADSRNHRVAVCSTELQLIGEIGQYQLKCPVDVKININQVFVIDQSEKNSVHIFSSSGDIKQSWLQVENSNGPKFLCFDSFNNILISDNDRNSIQIYTMDGVLMHTIPCEAPMDIRVTDSLDLICISVNNVLIY